MNSVCYGYCRWCRCFRSAGALDGTGDAGDRDALGDAGDAGDA